VVLIPEEPEDMWHAYNLVTAGDSIKSTTIRFGLIIHAIGRGRILSLSTIVSVAVFIVVIRSTYQGR